MTTVTLTLDKERAEAFSFALSDIICWSNGFEAGRREFSPEGPMGIERARDLNIALKDAIDKAEKGERE